MQGAEVTGQNPKNIQLLWFNPAGAQHPAAIHSLYMKWDEGETWKQNRTGG